MGALPVIARGVPFVYSGSAMGPPTHLIFEHLHHWSKPLPDEIDPYEYDWTEDPLGIYEPRQCGEVTPPTPEYEPETDWVVRGWIDGEEWGAMARELSGSCLIDQFVEEMLTFEMEKAGWIGGA